MSEGRKKKSGAMNPAEASTLPDFKSGTSIPTPTSPQLPIGDPFERILTTPKEFLIQRAASPRRSQASPLKSKGTIEVSLEQLPKLSGKNHFQFNTYFIFIILFSDQSFFKRKIT